MTIRLGTLGAAASVMLCLACATPRPPTSSATRSTEETTGTIAQIYYWRARPGKLQDYDRYIREVAEPIDDAARAHGAFVSVTTYVAQDTLVPWTHMRIFILRDSAQLRALGAALDAAGARLEPDSVKRRLRGEYAATLRDRVGQTTASVLR